MHIYHKHVDYMSVLVHVSQIYEIYECIYSNFMNVWTVRRFLFKYQNCMDSMNIYLNDHKYVDCKKRLYLNGRKVWTI